LSETWTRVAQSLRERLGARSAPRIADLSIDHSERLAEIHATAFAKPWSAPEFECFLTDAAVRLDGLFLGRAAQPSGFVVTRCVFDEAEILSVALAREARGRGHSRLLLAQHLRNLADRGVRHVHLEVEEGNRPALALYLRLGFVQSGRRQGYYARPDGTRANALSMTFEMA
jgi:ribosomal-protein-alanine N-acetyltransferase